MKKYFGFQKFLFVWKKFKKIILLGLAKYRKDCEYPSQLAIACSKLTIETLE